LPAEVKYSKAEVLRMNLKKILQEHELWLASNGREGLKANLTTFSLVPEQGSFEGWKKCTNGIILRLEITKTAKRVSSLVGRKCRASEVKVIEAFGHEEGTEISSTYDTSFKYRVGKKSSVEDFDDDIRVECTKGIHFFLTRKEAEQY
jgi:hypothetical protein